MAKASYKTAGVDLDAYADSMGRVAGLIRRTHSPRVLPLEGGFAGLFQLDFDSPLFARRYRDPVLVACTDGVGTKLKVAQMAGIHDTVGIDLVAMSVNDAICTGAEPLFFLDCLVMPSDDPPLVEQIVRGVTTGCLHADCALLGGETAIHPGQFPPGEYDLSGFCVGVVERRHVIDGRAIAADDIVLGVASSGLHSNGFSLARQIVFEIAGFDPHDEIESLRRTVASVLLEPTTIYAAAVRRVLSHYKVKSVVHGIAHITGGGLHENIQRILPEGTRVEIERDSWPRPAAFDWLAQLGQVDDAEMHRVFNMGIGLVLIVSPFFAGKISRMLKELGHAAYEIGRVIDGERGVVWASG